MTWRFPMTLTIRCYECGNVFDVMLTDDQHHDYPCPACGKLEGFELGEWAKKAEAWNQKQIWKRGGGR
jgi:phage FluMu protein Com